jgi:predicted AlkP superfamily pyrophosphatase or phosphodiesterase
MFNIKVFLLLSFINNAFLAPTHKSRNPTLLISIDGLREITLDQYLNANLNSNMHKEFVEGGTKADYMTPSFPASRFPNHFTLVTGEY